MSTIEQLEARFNKSYLVWLRKHAARKGLAWRAALEMAHRCERA